MTSVNLVAAVVMFGAGSIIFPALTFVFWKNTGLSLGVTARELWPEIIMLVAIWVGYLWVTGAAVSLAL